MRFLGLVMVVGVSACAAYTPHSLDAPVPPEGSVRAALSTAGAVRVSGIFGRPVQEVEGQILDTDGDSLRLRLLSTTEYGRPWDSSATLRLAKGEILRLDEKHVDGKRTALLVGGIGVVSGLVITALFKAAARSHDNEPSGGSDLTLISIFSIHR